jgi:fatty acid desaturase
MPLCSWEQRAPVCGCYSCHGYRPMFITYRRQSGIFALLTFAAVAFAATVLTVVVAATLLIAALGTAAALLLARVVLPASWRHHTIPPPTPWPRDTIEATVVHPNGSSDERDLLRMDSDKG